MELVTANVKRDDTHRPPVKQHLSKATGAGPDIKTGAAGRINLGKSIKPANQFERAPADPWKIGGR